MLRARHRNSLLRSDKGWRLWGATFTERKRGIATTTAVTSVQNAHGQSTADVELVEEGRSGWDFGRAVVTVVEIEEEVLFRNIITYL